MIRFRYGIPKARPRRLEQGLVNQIMLWLAYSSILYIHHRNSGAIYHDRASGQVRYGRSNFTQRGAPDILAWKAGKFYAIEVKSPTGRVSPEQTSWHQRFIAQGGVCIVARTLEDVQREFNSPKSIKTDI